MKRRTRRRIDRDKLAKWDRNTRCDATGKRRFRSHEAAVAEMKWQVETHRESDGSAGYVPLRAYRCEFCDEFHLTSRPDRYQVET